MIISITLPIRAIPKGRPRFGKGFTYTPAKTRHFESLVRQMVQAKTTHLSLPLVGPLSVAVGFYFKAPKRSSKGYPRPDVDNLLKALDALNGLLWRDDAQIVTITGTKQYAQEDMINIVVKRLTVDPA